PRSALLQIFSYDLLLLQLAKRLLRQPGARLAVLDEGELQLGAREQVPDGAAPRERSHPQDVALPLGHADGAARVEQVEDVRALQAIIVGRQRQLEAQQPVAFLLVALEELEEQLRVRGLEAVLRLLHLVLAEDVAGGTASHP